MAINVQNYYDLKSGNKRFSTLAEGMKGSQILKIDSEIKELQAQGKTVYNFTIGDFKPCEFPIPTFLKQKIQEAFENGETNYPPGLGTIPLRKALQNFYSKHLGLDFPFESFLVSSGARPLIYALFRATVDPQDKVLFPVPSWNNHHYAYLFQANGIAIQTESKDRFLPTRESLKKHISGATLLMLNSPLNPSGTVFSRDQLEGICDLVLEENAKRSRDQKPLYIGYDQIYWRITFDNHVHYSPLNIRPELAKNTVLIDGITKSFAATGLRVGWAASPPDLATKMVAAFGHAGSWAPRPAQIGTAKLLENEAELSSYTQNFNSKVQNRLDLIHGNLIKFKEEGLPVEVIEPMGAIYLSVYFGLTGKMTKQGLVLENNEAVRQYLLDRAGVAVVPFEAFGSDAVGWFRFSVGAVSLEEVKQAMLNLRNALLNIEL
ncbi:aminotransferase class I/II-fold pyridoxal phosphate-dependent enzyme [bacterium]|nr:aminotransferase class I/II-fold pyridoxal phosphate-dependent enzyme [bacterium]